MMPTPDCSPTRACKRTALLGAGGGGEGGRHEDHRERGVTQDRGATQGDEDHRDRGATQDRAVPQVPAVLQVQVRGGASVLAELPEPKDPPELRETREPKETKGTPPHRSIVYGPIG